MTPSESTDGPHVGPSLQAALAQPVVLSVRPSRGASPTSAAEPLARAADPTTSPAELRRLARHRERRVREAVAANPNTGQDVLLSLALVVPEIVAANAVLEWWLLENPNWLADIDDRARHALLGAAALRDGTRWWAARFGTSDDHVSVLRTSGITADLARHIAASSDDDSVVWLAEQHVALPAPDHEPDPFELLSDDPLFPEADEAQDLLALCTPATWAIEALDLTSVDLRRVLAQDASTPRGVLRRLLLDDDERVLASVATRLPVDDPDAVVAARIRSGAPDLSADELELALSAPNGHRFAAGHPNLAPDRIDDLVNDDSWMIRQSVAANPNLSDSQVERLAVDGDRDVRVAIASHPRLPLPLLRAMTSDRDDLVKKRAADVLGARTHAASEADDRESADSTTARVAVAELRRQCREGRAGAVAVRPGLPPSIVRELLQHEQWYVRHALARNAEIGRAALAALANDTDLDVRRAVASHAHVDSRTLTALASDSLADIRAIVAGRTTRPTVMRALLADTASAVRAGLAANPRLPAAMLRALAEDGDSSVRIAVAGRTPPLTTPVQMLLAQDRFAETKLALLARAELAPGALSLLLDGHETTYRRLRDGAADLSEAEVAGFVESCDWIALHLSACPRLADTTQRVLARNTGWKVREALAARSDTDPEILALLAADSDYDTRAAAAGNPALPSSCLDALAVDPHRLVRLRLVERADLDPAAIESLLLDDDDDVRRSARSRLAQPSPTVIRLEQLVAGTAMSESDLEPFLAVAFARRLVASHPSATADQLDALAADGSWEVREAVARHPTTRSSTLHQLADDSDRDVRRAVASQTRTDALVVERLTQDADPSVARAATMNPSRSPRQREVSARRALSRALRSPNADSRILALTSPFVPAGELSRRRNRRHADWHVRSVVALQEHTPTWVLEELSADGIRPVASLARATLVRRRDAPVIVSSDSTLASDRREPRP